MEKYHFFDMTQDELRKAWVVRNEAPDAWSVSAQGLQLNSRMGEMMGSPKTVKNVFLHSVDGDWLVETKVGIKEPLAENFQQAGIVVCGTGGDFVKLVYLVNGVPGLQLAYEKDGCFISPSAVGMEPETIWFRLRKQGDVYTAYYTVEDPAFGFQELGSCCVHLENPQVGFVAFNGNTTAAPVTFTFGYFDFLPFETPAETGYRYDVTLDKQCLRLKKGESARLIGSTPDGESNDVAYRAVDKSVVQVDETGLVTACGEGYTVVSAYAKDGRPAFCAIAVAAEKPCVHRSEGNPYLPVWEHIPDGEPYVFEDPDNLGKFRLYVYGSHDSKRLHYCGYEAVLWSAPVEDLTEWTYHGEIFKSTVHGAKDTIYAPDVAEVVAADGSKTYYFYPNNQSGGRRGMVTRSNRPDGPFTVCNWAEGSTTQTVGPLGFDVTVLLDDDGRVYGYWGFENNEPCSWAELDPQDMAALKAGTEIHLNLPTRTDIERPEYDPTRYNIVQDEHVDKWGFFEAPSIRKLGNKYVLIFSRRGLHSEPTGCNTWQLGYGYSDSPEGPWKWGGIIVDAGGEAIPEGNGSYQRTFPADNTHGSIIEVNGQWYVFYHRANNRFARQAMADKLDLVEWDDKPVAEGGEVRIRMAEMTSNGLYIHGLNPYAEYPASIVCYLTNGAEIPVVYDCACTHDAVVIHRDQTIAGVKYFDMNRQAPEGESTNLALTLVPRGVEVTMDVYLRPEEAVNTAAECADGRIVSVGKGSIRVGSAAIRADMPPQPVTLHIPMPQKEALSGRWGLFFVFNGAAEGDLCEFRSFEMYSQK